MNTPITQLVAKVEGQLITQRRAAQAELLVDTGQPAPATPRLVTELRAELARRLANLLRN